MLIRSITPFLFFLAAHVHAQSGQLPDGLYMTLEQLKEGKPSSSEGIDIKRRLSSEIALNGGNDYKLFATGDTIEKKYLKKELYAFVRHDSLFLNCFPHKLGTWYALALTRGNFLVFKAAMPNGDAVAMGFMFGAIGAMATANDRYLYVLSQRTGNVRALTTEYMDVRLKENGMEGSLDTFHAEVEANEEAAMLKYIALLNGAVAVPTR